MAVCMCQWCARTDYLVCGSNFQAMAWLCFYVKIPIWSCAAAEIREIEKLSFTSCKSMFPICRRDIHMGRWKYLFRLFRWKVILWITVSQLNSSLDPMLHPVTPHAELVNNLTGHVISACKGYGMSKSPRQERLSSPIVMLMTLNSHFV